MSKKIGMLCAMGVGLSAKYPPIWEFKDLHCDAPIQPNRKRGKFKPRTRNLKKGKRR